MNKPLQNKTFQPVCFKSHFIISYNYTQTALKTMAYSEATGGISVLSRTMVNLILLTPNLRCLYKGPFVLIAVSQLFKTHFRDTLFACWVMLVAILMPADFSQNQLFQRIL